MVASSFSLPTKFNKIKSEMPSVKKPNKHLTRCFRGEELSASRNQDRSRKYIHCWTPQRRISLPNEEVAVNYKTVFVPYGDT